MNTSARAVILFLLIIVAAFFVTEYMTIYEPGFTVTSITTSPHIITPSTSLNSATFLITTVFDAGGQSIVGYLSPDEVQQESGYETEYTLKISAQAVDEIVDYPIINQPNLRMHEYSLEIFEDYLWPLGDVESCPTYTHKHTIHEVNVYGVLTERNYCVYEEDVGAIGYLDNPTTSFNTKISLSARGEIFTEEINSFESTSASFYDDGDFLATAKWTGSLVTGNMPPSEALYIATYRIDTDNRWHITDKSKYNVYTTILSDANDDLTGARASKECQEADYVGCQAIFEDAIYSMNTGLSTLSTGAEPGIGDVDTKINPNSLSSGTLRATFDRQFSNPQVTFLINAAWVGVKFGVGQPEITSVYAPTFSSGDNIGVCDVLYKNVGSAEGTFRASFIPSPGSSFAQQYVVTPTLLQPGETANVQVYISHGTAVEESSVGTIKVIDINDASRYDTKEVSLTMTEPKSCIPGAEEARGQSIYKCNVAGTGWDLIETCAEGTVPGLNDAGTNLECRELIDVDRPDWFGFGAFFDDLIKSLFGDEFGTEDIIPLIITIVMVLVILYLAVLILPILLPLLGKALLGLLLGRK